MNRLVLPALVAGMVVGGLTNSALVAWIVALTVGGALYARLRIRGGSLGAAACTVPATARGGRAYIADDLEDVEDVEDGTTAPSVRRP